VSPLARSLHGRHLADSHPNVVATKEKTPLWSLDPNNPGYTACHVTLSGVTLAGTTDVSDTGSIVDLETLVPPADVNGLEVSGSPQGEATKETEAGTGVDSFQSKSVLPAPAPRCIARGDDVAHDGEAIHAAELSGTALGAPVQERRNSRDASEQERVDSRTLSQAVSQAANGRDIASREDRTCPKPQEEDSALSSRTCATETDTEALLALEDLRVFMVASADIVDAVEAPMPGCAGLVGADLGGTKILGQPVEEVMDEESTWVLGPDDLAPEPVGNGKLSL
jgi:hypothetical protein